MSSLQTTLQAIQDRLATDAPPFGLGGGGIILALIALKAGKGILRLVLLLVAVGAVAGAVFWFLHRHN